MRCQVSSQRHSKIICLRLNKAKKNDDGSRNLGEPLFFLTKLENWSKFEGSRVKKEEWERAEPALNEANG